MTMETIKTFCTILSNSFNGYTHKATSMHTTIMEVFKIIHVSFGLRISFYIFLFYLDIWWQSFDFSFIFFIKRAVE